jgi:hypothetical protein
LSLITYGKNKDIRSGNQIKVTNSPTWQNVDFLEVKPGGIHRMFLLSPHQTRRLNRIVSLHPPVYPMRAAALSAMMKGSPSFVTTACQRDK